jgi:hypothetical protein
MQLDACVLSHANIARTPTLVTALDGSNRYRAFIMTAACHFAGLYALSCEAGGLYLQVCVHVDVQNGVPREATALSRPQ